MIIAGDEDDVAILSEVLYIKLRRCRPVCFFYDVAFFITLKMWSIRLPKLILTDHISDWTPAREFIKDLRELEIYKHTEVIL